MDPEGALNPNTDTSRLGQIYSVQVWHTMTLSSLASRGSIATLGPLKGTKHEEFDLDTVTSSLKNDSFCIRQSVISQVRPCLWMKVCLFIFMNDWKYRLHMQDQLLIHTSPEPVHMITYPQKHTQRVPGLMDTVWLNHGGLRRVSRIFCMLKLEAQYCCAFSYCFWKIQTNLSQAKLNKPTVSITVVRFQINLHFWTAWD